jgi:hypothetical protein
MGCKVISSSSPTPYGTVMVSYSGLTNGQAVQCLWCLVPMGPQGPQGQDLPYPGTSGISLTPPTLGPQVPQHLPGTPGTSGTSDTSGTRSGTLGPPGSLTPPGPGPLPWTSGSLTPQDRGPLVPLGPPGPETSGAGTSGTRTSGTWDGWDSGTQDLGTTVFRGLLRSRPAF